MKVTALISLFAVVGTVVQAYDGEPLVTQQSSSVQDNASKLCSELVEKARAIDTLLHTVKDKESADAAAIELHQYLVDMQSLLADLEQLPFDADTTTVITVQMTALTHITQAYMPLIHELQQKGAYGSDALLIQLHKHNEDNGYAEPTDIAPVLTPLEQLQHDLAENISNALYAVRKAVDASTAKDAVLALTVLLDERRAVVKNMEELMATQQAEPADDATHLHSLQYLKTQLESELNRLQEVQFYGDPDLPLLLPEYINLIQ